MKIDSTLRLTKTILVSSILAVSAVGFSQSVTGKVLDASGGGIENALVRHANDPSKWTKTSADGSYTINGARGTNLRVGALHYETRTSVNVNNTTSFNITLQEDQLKAVEDDVYHINFDHLRPGPNYSKDEVKDDFPVASGKGFDEGRVSIDPNVSLDAGGQSMKIKFPEGGAVTCCSGLDLRIPLAKTYRDNDFASDDIYLSYWVKFKDDWNWDKCGGKMPSLGGSKFNSREDTWKGRIMWANHGTIRFYPEMPNADNGIEGAERFWGTSPSNNNDICDQGDRTEYLKGSGWHNIEFHYVMDNGPGTTGYFEGWVDGEPTANRISSDKFGYWRAAGNEDVTINAILISFFHGGSSDSKWQPDKDEYCWVDEFRVSESRINDWNRFQNPVGLESAKTSNFKVFPNPSNGLFKLSEETAWTILTPTGVELTSGNGSQIDLSGFDNGLYILNTESGSLKLIKN